MPAHKLRPPKPIRPEDEYAGTPMPPRLNPLQKLLAGIGLVFANIYLFVFGKR